jgi:Tfp pilus assembly protein PilN
VRAVNLLPRDLERARSGGSRVALLVAGGGLAAVTASALVLGLSASGIVDDRRAELAALESAIAAAPRAGEPAVSQSTLSQERADRVAALSAALATRIPFDRLLRELSLVLPEDAWLTGLTASAPVSAGPTSTSPVTPPAAAGTLQGVTIQGATYSHKSVARVLARLAVLPSLENVLLDASARVEPESAIDESGSKKKKTTKRKTVVTFSITATLRTGSSS